MHEASIIQLLPFADQSVRLQHTVMHKATMHNFITAYDACTITIAKMSLAVVAASSNLTLLQ